MKRTRFLVCYDISNPKRLRRVAKVLEGYGRRLQFSVFECPLGSLRFSKLKSDLQGVLNHDQDQVMFVSLGGAEADAGLVIETMGQPYVAHTRITVV
ncbi:MAG: CRISPR-associated endonuclease Cas2 [Nitrospirae bacterium]|nr:CRISPR-associated endonuclease Cas2 [Nitrospirota bacterium]